MKFIDYNEEGDIVPIHRSNDYDAKGDRYEVAYGNRQLLNDWCLSSHGLPHKPQLYQHLKPEQTPRPV